MSNNLPAGLDDLGGTPDAGLNASANGALAFRQPPLPEEGVNWRRHLSALYRYKWLVVLTTILGAAAGVALTKLMVPLFETRTMLVISDGQPKQNTGFGPIQPNQLLATPSLVALVRTPKVLEPVVREQRLFVGHANPADSAAFSTFGISSTAISGMYRLQVDPTGQTFTLSLQSGAVIGRGKVGDSVGVSAGMEWVPPAGTLKPGANIAFWVRAVPDAVGLLASQLDPRADQGGMFMTISLTGPDPVRVAATLNATARHYVAAAGDLQRYVLTQQAGRLGEQLAYARDNMAKAQNALMTFKVDNVTQPSEASASVAMGVQIVQNPAFTNFFQIKLQRELLRHDRERIQRILKAIPDSGLASDALRVVTSAQAALNLQTALNDLTTKQTDLRNERAILTDSHPTVKNLMARVNDLERNVIPRIAEDLVRDIRTREADLDARIAADSSAMQQIPRRAIEESRLALELQSATLLYTDLRKRHEDVRLAEQSSVTEVRVFAEAAVPRSPLRNTASRILMIAIVGGLMLGLAGALLLDRLDKRVRYPEQISNELGLAILGAIPHIKGARNGSLNGDAALETVESLRGVRLGLSHAHGAAGPFITTITSPGPGDGKSFLASNLARSYAGTGLKTLLIDGDTRRGELHRIFGMQRKPGLLDFLAGTVTREQLIQPTKHAGLDFIGAGTRSQKGPELLQSPMMTKLILSLRGSYQVILVDSPPLNAGIDPFVLGTATGNLVLVVRNGVTDRELAGAKLDVLDRLPVRVLGAVLNDIRTTSSYRYYRYQYSLKGYEAEDEESDVEVRLLPK